MLTKLAFYEQQSFALFRINNSDFLLVQRKRLFSSFVTPDFKKEQNRNEAERNQIYCNICFFGDRIINTFSIESSK